MNSKNWENKEWISKCKEREGFKEGKLIESDMAKRAHKIRTYL